MNRKPLLILLSIIVAGLAAGCILKYSRQSHAREYSRQFFAMDTVMSFTAYGERGEEAVEAAVQEVERRMHFSRRELRRAKCRGSMHQEREICLKIRKRFYLKVLPSGNRQEGFSM